VLSETFLLPTDTSLLDYMHAAIDIDSFLELCFHKKIYHTKNKYTVCKVIIYTTTLLPDIREWIYYFYRFSPCCNLLKFKPPSSNYIS